MLNNIRTSQLLSVFVLLLLVVLVSIFSGKMSREEGSAPISSHLASEPNQEVLAKAEEILDYCSKNAAKHKGKENCYADEFEKMAASKGPEFSFSVLGSLQRKDRDAVGCHLIAHGIGWGSYKGDPQAWRALVRNMPTICNYGAIHGVLEGYILSLPGKSLTREVIPTICGENPRADCNHIIGHLLLVQTDADVDKALGLCEVFRQNPRQEDFCITGVFMEYQTALNLIDHDLVPVSWQNWPARVPDLEKMCRSYDGKHAIGCWEEIVHAALAKFNNDPKKIFDFCATAQLPEAAQKCKRHSLGIIGASRNFELSRLKDVCTVPQENDPTFEKECYANMVASSLSTVPGMLGGAVAFCSSLKKDFQDACFSMIGTMGHSNEAIKRDLPQACEKAPSEFRNFCLGNSSTGNGIIGSERVID